MTARQKAVYSANGPSGTEGGEMVLDVVVVENDGSVTVPGLTFSETGGGFYVTLGEVVWKNSSGNEQAAIRVVQDETGPGIDSIEFWGADGASASARMLRVAPDGTFSPGSDGAGDIGDPLLRWGNIYVSTSVNIDTISIRPGTGTPEGVVTAPVGSLYLRTDGGAGTTLYVKESGAGNTGWVGK